MSLKRGRCNNIITRFTLNFIADKIKIFSLLDTPSDVQLKKIEDCLENDIKSIISFNFCYNCIKVYCSLENPKEFDEIEGKQVFGEIKFFSSKKMFTILMCDCKKFGLDQLNVKYKSSFYFGCSCSVEHKIFATKCENCRYNVAGFARNYFSSINCSC